MEQSCFFKKIYQKKAFFSYMYFKIYSVFLFFIVNDSRNTV